MNPTAATIAILYGAVTLISVVVVLLIWWSTHRRRKVDHERLAEREKAWFGIAIVLLAILLFATIFFTPYSETAPAADKQTVTVEGVQFAWVMNPTTLRAGVPTEFVVRASDVNHGFAVYNDDGVLLFQVQAVPDADTKVYYTFKVPGEYEVLCLEFCGVNHHGMKGTLEVVEQ